MSLVRLLTAGKSLIGLEHVESRYRMRGKYLLPKFGADKNPFTKTFDAPPEAMAEGAATDSPRELSPAEMEAASLKETRRLPTIPAIETNSDSNRAPAAMMSRAVSFGAQVMKGAMSMGRRALISGGEFLKQRGGAMVRKANPAVLLPLRKPAPHPFSPPDGTAPVQGELSLDNVKVVRNDLTEADVEVVMAKPPAKVKPVPATPAACAEGEIELIKT